MKYLPQMDAEILRPCLDVMRASLDATERSFIKFSYLRAHTSRTLAFVNRSGVSSLGCN